jgi:soluble lytic murein transglycosylase
LLISEIITQAAVTAGVSPALLLAICFQESSFLNVVVPHDGKSASWGVCQVKHSTAKWIEPGTHPSSLLDPVVNSRIAAKYVSWLLTRYKKNQWCAATAYNSGPSRLRPVECVRRFSSRYSRKIKKHMEVRPWLKLRKKR